MKRFISLICLTVFILAGCSSATLGGEKLKVDTDVAQLSQPQSGDTIAVIKTNKGTIKVLLFPDLAQKAVQNFILLAQQGYYDGVTFHRAIEDFIIQSGSPDGSSEGGKSVWGIEFEDEFSGLLHHYNGALAMANHGSDTNGSQFFFVTAPINKMDDETVQQMTDAGWSESVIETYKQAGGLPQLDYRYTVFGQIYDGLDTAYSISRVKTDDEDKPQKDVIIESIEISVVE